MSYSIIFDEGDGSPDVFSFATTAGLAEFGRWVETLPAAVYPALRELAESGSYEGTDRLSRELESAMKSHRPAMPEVESVARNLAEKLGVGASQETAHITDDGGEPDEWEDLDFDEEPPTNGQASQRNGFHHEVTAS